MRIIAGRWRGRQIAVPSDAPVRPTGDRVREAWMSIVGPLLPDARVLDLFSGSGALGLEALSRGAVSADFVDNAPRSLRALGENARTLGAGAAAVIHHADALAFAARLPAHAFDLAFADPPYDQGLATRVAECWIAVPFATSIGIEHRSNERLPGEGNRRQYGGTAITFYTASETRVSSGA